MILGYCKIARRWVDSEETATGGDEEFFRRLFGSSILGSKCSLVLTAEGV
jgi:hypothetical protein